MTKCHALLGDLVAEALKADDAQTWSTSAAAYARFLKGEGETRRVSMHHTCVCTACTPHSPRVRPISVLARGNFTCQQCSLRLRVTHLLLNSPHLTWPSMKISLIQRFSVYSRDDPSQTS